MKQLITLILLASILLFNGCSKYKKNVQDYYPKVKVTSASLQDDGSVVVTGTVISEGADKIMYRGFCMDVVSNPKMTSNQMVINDPEASFTATYKSLSKSNKYYFKAFAANSYGYSIGEGEVTIDSVYIKPPTTPCTLPLDTFTENNTVTTKSEKIRNKYVYSSTRFRATTDNHTIDLEFKIKPVSGVYKIWENTSNNDNVTILMDRTYVTNGAKLYVTEIDNKTIEITVCSMNYYDDLFRSCTSSMKLRFTYP